MLHKRHMPVSEDHCKLQMAPKPVIQLISLKGLTSSTPFVLSTRPHPS